MKTVLAGSAKRLVGAAYWHDYHLLVYETALHEVVVLNDSQILHIISFACASGSPVEWGLTVAFNPLTAAIAVTNSTKIVIYECTEMFGKLPIWRISTEIATNGKDVVSMAWLDTDRLGLADSEGLNAVYNISEQSIAWSEHIGHRSLTVWSHNAFVSFDRESSALILIQLDFRKSPAVLGKMRVIDLGFHRPLDVCMANSEVLVAQTPEAKFVYQLDPEFRVAPQLRATLPLSGCVVDCYDDDKCVLITSKSGVKKLNYLSASPAWEHDSEPTWGRNSLSIGAATRQRIYLISYDQGTIETYERSSDYLVCRISGTSQKSSSTSLTTSSRFVVAGESVFERDTFQEIARVGVPDVVHTILVDANQIAVATAQTLCLYRKSNAQYDRLVWSQPLTQFPMSIGVLGSDTLAVVFSNSMILFNVSNGRSCFSSSIPFPIQNAFVSSEMVVVEGDGRLQAISSNEKASAVLELSENIVAISVCQKYVSISTSNKILVLRNNNDKLVTICDLPASGPVDGLSIRTLANHTLILAVIIGHKITAYALTNRINPQLLVISEITIDPIPLRNGKLAWISDEDVAYFNGRQLVVSKVTGFSESQLQINHEFAMNLPTSLTLPEIVSVLNQPVPIYHPSVLLLIFQAFRPQLAAGILKKLGSQILFADIEEVSGMELVLLDQQLGYVSLHEVEETSEYSEVKLTINSRRRLAGLTLNEQNILQKLSDLLANGRLQDLDPSAICALVLFEAYESPKYEAWSYAWLSQTQPELKSKFDTLSTHPSSLHVWLENSVLANELEQLARKEFAQNRDPPDVSLYYLALHKADTLKTLWRISGGHPEREKTLKLLSNDFTTSRWRTAAQKNAYALMSRKRYVYAAALFLLGESIKDCCQVIMAKMGNIDLAVAVSRVFSGDASPGLEYIAGRLETTLMDENFEEAQWTRFFLLMVLGRTKQATECLSMGLSTMLMYAQRGGTVTDENKQSWIRQLGEAGLPRIVYPLVESLENVDLRDFSPVSDKTTATTKSVPTEENEEYKPPPAHLKPPPVNIPLEPDMSAFGF